MRIDLLHELVLGWLNEAALVSKVSKYYVCCCILEFCNQLIHWILLAALITVMKSEIKLYFAQSPYCWVLLPIKITLTILKCYKHLQSVRFVLYMALTFISLQMVSRSPPCCNCWKKLRNIASGNPINLIGVSKRPGQWIRQWVNVTPRLINFVLLFEILALARG